VISTGIDEVGYGPVLGPLVVAAITVESPQPEDLAALTRLGVTDSKQVHRGAGLTRLERIALPLARWCTGRPLRTYAELLAAVADDLPARAWPWQFGADTLTLPVEKPVTTWDLPQLRPVRARADLLHPAHLNAARAGGINRSQAEAAAIQGHIAAVVGHGGRITVDRLGGRTHYRDLLRAACPHLLVVVASETPAQASYHLGGPDGVAVRFAVGAEALDPLVAAASCLGKYLRELDMLLLNRHMTGRAGGALRPTAGYPQDARRWLAEAQIAPDEREALVRAGAVQG
jgi:ribonuclease HII